MVLVSVDTLRADALGSYGGHEFYDLANDPGELNDLFGAKSGEPSDAVQAERGAALLDLINAHRADARVVEEAPELAPEVRAALDALGYAE